jgi:hypothetical protein
VALKSGNWIAWALLVLALVVVMKFVIKLSKSIVITLIIIGIFFALGRLNPNLTEMVVETVLDWIPDSLDSGSDAVSADPE